MTLSQELLPDRLSQALNKLAALQQEQIYFAPIRHHSPSCSFALKKLIEQTKPTHILIEAPVSFTPLIEQLLHDDTRPPIAILSQTEIDTIPLVTESEDDSVSKQSTCSVFYPFCHYSPEWVAIQMAKEQHATLQFIDLPWALQCDQEIAADFDKSRSLLSETYLKHSQYIQYLMKKLHCRDHDEVWEHLFELKDYNDIADWQNFFIDTFIWCAMARLDYSPSSLAAEGSVQREQYMLTAIGQLKKSQPDAKIVVVTGGFHTLPLLEGLWHDQLVLPKKAEMTRFNHQQKSSDKDQNWLIRYSFDRLDSLNGYASGMPSPAYYQAAWQSMLLYDKSTTNGKSCIAFRQSLTADMLTDIVDKLRQQNSDNIIGFIPFRSAIAQSMLLANLREHHGPGRYDLLDAIQSCFIKESINDSRHEFWLTVQNCLSGNLLGEIPKGIAQPPLVNEVYLMLKKYRFKLDYSSPKLTHIDIYRKSQHRQRSRYLHLLAFLQVGFANRIDGPDYIHGKRLSIMFEDWRYAWTPMVEAHLIKLSEQGTQLEQIAIKQLQLATEQSGQNSTGFSSIVAVEQLIQGALMGLESCFAHLLNNLSNCIENDNELDNLINCGHRLLYLWQGQNFLQLKNTATLLILLVKIIKQSLFLLTKLKQPEQEQQQKNIKILLSFRDLLNYLPEQLNVKQFKHDFYHNLHRLQPELAQLPLICGAIDSLSYLDAYLSQQQLEDKIKINFSLNTPNDHAIHYFIGIMQCTPQLIIHSSFLLNSLDQLMIDWSPERFIEILPDLRYAFSQLNPTQNASLASQIAKKYHIADNELDFYQYNFSEKELNKALSLELFITKHIQQQHLQTWFKQ